MKIDALTFSFAGDKYLGRSYAEMDCQKFVEKCMADSGYPRDLGGSNSWYRECMRNGWTGTPEDCVREFGLVPKGALLFIHEEVSESTPAKFRNDGIGDITHMGIKTGRNDGAIHSSHSKGKVVTSKFQDKTIKNGGWNRVGLLKDFDYGKSVNWILDHENTGGEPPAGEDEKPMMVTVTAPSGSTVNMRQKANKSSSLVERVPIGAEVELLEGGEEWSRVRYGKKTGWMMTDFLIADDSAAPAEPEPADPGDGDPAEDSEKTYAVTIYGLDLSQAKAIAANYPGNSEIEEEVIAG